ncbi:unnamed protein product [Didymodactylos carnosus]|uniref:ADP ribosyltransferase domain-containing protein n=1 Tax=Didymodactylos carnosus TaxID=1234261 RepID=A0A8S2FGI1_9BILA|nr:unnamed protein product [Didymodactylos carnosus]CAF4254789.1 unnamed protein product [Didymodactylos carnosus]
MLNQAFRDENLDNIFIYRSFIRDLSDQIDILHMEQRESGFDSCTVYRGTCLAYDDIAVLKSNKGKLISFNGFLSTSVYAEVAELFKQPSNDQEQMESVLFEYYIDANLETSSFAYVAFLSASPDEGEVLFNIGTIFRINQIKYDESKKLWHVHCALCAKSEVGHHFMDVERKTEAYNFFYFGYLLVMAGETDRAEKFYLKILREEVDITVKALCYCRLARIYSDKGEWTRSIDMYKKLFQHSSYLSKNYGEFSKLINIDKRIVRVVVEIGEYDLALQLLTQELSLLDDTDPNHSYHLAIVLFNIATVYKLRGDDERAREYFKQIEELSDDSFTGPEEAALHNNIALMAMDRGDVDVALRYFRKAATILRETLPSMHEEFVTLYNNIGFAFTKQGNLDSALEYFNMALKIADSPSKSKYLMNVYLHLGYVHSLRGDFDVTETFYEKALLLLPEKLPEYRSSLAGIYTNTGTVLAEREKLDAFEMVFTKASEIYSQNMSSRMAAICFEHMADLYAKKHLFAKALIFSTRALEMQMQGYGENHHSTATAYRQLADMYYMSGDENRASEFHKKSLSILENITVSSEASEIERATLYESMGTVHLDRAECALGCEYYMKSLKIREHLLSEKHPDLIKTYVLLGRSYFRLGELDLATNL